MPELPWRLRTDGLTLIVRLTPRSSADAIEGIEDRADGQSVLKARVRAIPEKGEANQALLQLVARTLRIPASAISLEAGATARLKTLRLTGDTEALQSALTDLAAATAARPQDAKARRKAPRTAGHANS